MSPSPTPHSADAPEHYQPLDPGRIDLMNPVELQYWCGHFQCTEERLRQAVATTGTHVAAVRQALGGPG